MATNIDKNLKENKYSAKVKGYCPGRREGRGRDALATYPGNKRNNIFNPTAINWRHVRESLLEINYKT